jgi:hypothetical protein
LWTRRQRYNDEYRTMPMMRLPYYIPNQPNSQCLVLSLTLSVFGNETLWEQSDILYLGHVTQFLVNIQHQSSFYSEFQSPHGSLVIKFKYLMVFHARLGILKLPEGKGSVLVRKPSTATLFLRHWYVEDLCMTESLMMILVSLC